MQNNFRDALHTAFTSGPIAGILWALVSAVFLAGIAVIARYAALNGVPPLQVVFFRVIFALITMLPLLMWRGTELASTRHWPIYLLRSMTGLIAMYTFFIAVAIVAVGKLTAISFLAPVFATISAVVFLGEKVQKRRGIATIAGLIGALIIIRPGLLTISTGVLLAVCSAFFMGLSTTLIKRLTNSDDPDKVVFIATLIMTPVTLVPAVFVWQWPAGHVWLALLALGPVAVLGHAAMARAFAAAEASTVVSLDFARLPFAVFFGFVVFGETIDGWTWLGAAVIFAAGVYITHRESVLRKTSATTVNITE